ncbi:hypothetical protein [Arhodomonas aquaeolei]|uniref:hypothetical protein n=1 Tax=Arhodomonas aquaeolei TaxID=2369 RepID=UPI00036F4282|nr:hypothetical protein [Arhodomonas aquaeolei]
MKVMNVRVPDELRRAAEREASLNGVYRSELVRAAIRAYLENLERERHLAVFLQQVRAVYDDEALRADSRDIASAMSEAEAGVCDW